MISGILDRGFSFSGVVAAPVSLHISGESARSALRRCGRGADFILQKTKDAEKSQNSASLVRKGES